MINLNLKRLNSMKILILTLGLTFGFAFYSSAQAQFGEPVVLAPEEVAKEYTDKDMANYAKVAPKLKLTSDQLAAIRQVFMNFYTASVKNSINPSNIKENDPVLDVKARLKEILTEQQYNTLFTIKKKSEGASEPLE
jgi:hypothetical protein